MKAIICDIDGTLADCRHRLRHVLPGGKRDWESFFAGMADDNVVYPVRAAVQSLARDYKIVLCSGRPEKYRGVTVKWLDEWCVPFDSLYMRPDNDTRPDHVVKAQLLSGLRKDGFDPFLVIDDRQSVVDMWRDHGLLCMQVAPVDTSAPGTARLTLMVGPSGSGKSSWLESADAWHYGIDFSHVVSSDQIRADLCGDFRDQSKNQEVFAALHAVVKARLKAGLPTVVDATNIRRKDRVSLATLLNVAVTYIVINRPIEEKRRDGGWRLEVPELLERHEATFQANLKDILRGDNLMNVAVVDLRQLHEMKEAA